MLSECKSKEYSQTCIYTIVPITEHPHNGKLIMCLLMLNVKYQSVILSSP